MNSKTNPVEQPLALGDSSGPDSVDLEKVAHLVACGQMPLPADLSPRELRQVVHQVRAACRRRLLNLIASTIAQDLMHCPLARTGVSIHDETQD